MRVVLCGVLVQGVILLVYLLLLALALLLLALDFDAGVWLGAHLWSYSPDPWYIVP